MDLTLNETPIRTAKNYSINNINLENIEIPDNIQEFNGLKFLGNTTDFEILEMNKITEFKYGNGKILEVTKDTIFKKKDSIIVFGSYTGIKNCFIKKVRETKKNVIELIEE